MRFSQPTNPLSSELAKLTIRLYDALRLRGVSVKMVCSRSPEGYFIASRSKYLHINSGAQMIRISDHRAPGHLTKLPDLDVLVTSLGKVAEAETRALAWINQEYGFPQVQTSAA